ncbi:receptor-like protein 13 [Cornus florida]|uniref:receptor-like protein 13 n=1 Tax=Cornus florida TaxID=4283 RepID=UPI00289835FA|nr:receptor-like protein 13 [Cornus florida]
MEYLERELMRLSIMLLLVLVNVCHGCREQERIALLQLKDSINHPNGSSLPSWEDWDGEEPTDCCEWEGVECNATTRRIIKLSLNSTREYELGDWYLNTSMFLPFESLVNLDLTNNVLLGCIENEGFEKLSRLSNLHILDLSENYFNNRILSSLNGLSSLKTLRLYDNNLTGQVYIEDFDSLNNLKELNISWNRLESIVSREGFEKLSGLSNLQILDLSSNSHNNSILSSLSGLSSLNTLKLQQNNLIGQLYIQDFNDLNNLKELDISRNDLASIITREDFFHASSLITSLKLSGSTTQNFQLAYTSLRLLILLRVELGDEEFKLDGEIEDNSYGASCTSLSSFSDSSLKMMT